LESFQHTSFSDQSTPPFDILKNLAAKVFVPAAVEQKAKLVHLQQVTWRRFVVRARERRELDDGRHPLHWNWNQYGTKGLAPTWGEIPNYLLTIIVTLRLLIATAQIR